MVQHAKRRCRAMNDRRLDHAPEGDSAQGRDPDYPGHAESEKPKSGKRVRMVMGTEITARPVSWLWSGWLAHGKLHILAGRPGCLKTTTAIGFAAGVTVGGQWPDGSQMAQGNVVMWSGEDAIDDTLLPRFLAAGGDPAHVAFIKGVEEDGKTRAFDPASDMEELTEVCATLGGVNLILVDPVVSITRGDSHKNAETRRDLRPLVDLAERTQAAVIGIHHLTKRSEGADPVDRVSGSLAFGAAPRVILLSALDYRGGAEPRDVLMRAKSDIGPSHGGYGFTAEQRPLDDEPDISAQRILWGDFVPKSAREMLEEIEGDAERKAQALCKAAEFVRLALTNRGTRMAAEVIAEGVAAGFNERTLRRAFKTVGGTAERVGFGKGGVWIWELPGLAS
jgi:putative DNA primase/helicase